MKSIDLSKDIEYMEDRHAVIREIISTPEGRAYFALSMSVPEVSRKEYIFKTWIPFIKALLNYEEIRNNNSN